MTGKPRLPLPLLIACWKERHEVLLAADPNDEHSLVGGLPGLIAQTIARLEEMEARVVDTQYSAPLATASQNEPVPNEEQSACTHSAPACADCQERFMFSIRRAKKELLRHPTRAEIG